MMTRFNRLYCFIRRSINTQMTARPQNKADKTAKEETVPTIILRIKSRERRNINKEITARINPGIQTVIRITVPARSKKGSNEIIPASARKGIENGNVDITRAIKDKIIVREP